MLETETRRVLSTGASVPVEPGWATGTSVNSQARKLTPLKTGSLRALSIEPVGHLLELASPPPSLPQGQAGSKLQLLLRQHLGLYPRSWPPVWDVPASAMISSVCHHIGLVFEPNG